MWLGYLRHLYDGDAPFATLWTETTHNTPIPDALRQLDLRWRAAREALAADGARPDDLDALQGSVGPAPTPGEQSQFLVASGGRVLVEEHLPARPLPEVARWSALPHLLPWLVSRSHAVPHLLVRVDREGATIDLGDIAGHDEQTEVEGDRYPISKNAPGGWSQRRYQKAADETWEHNAAAVAEAVDGLRRRYRPQTVLLTGDVRARALLLDRLPVASRGIAEELDGIGRAAGASEDALARELDEALEHRRRTRTEEAADRYEESRAHGVAVDGLDRVVTALAHGAVDVLLVAQPELPQQVWTGPEPLMLALTADDLAGTGVSRPVAERADAALVRALVAQDGRLVPVGPDRLALRDGVGAIMRYQDRDATGGGT